MKDELRDSCPEKDTLLCASCLQTDCGANRSTAARLARLESQVAALEDKGAALEANVLRMRKFCRKMH